MTKSTWWPIPLSKWVITPVINEISRVNPLITGVITHLLSGMASIHRLDFLGNFKRQIIDIFAREIPGNSSHFWWLAVPTARHSWAGPMRRFHQKSRGKAKRRSLPKAWESGTVGQTLGWLWLGIGLVGLKPRTGDSCPVSNLSVQVAMHDYWNICWKKDDGLRTLKPKIGVLSQRKGCFIVAKHFLSWRECTQWMIPNPLIHALGVSWRQPGHPSTTLPATGAGSRWANRNGGHQDAHPRWPVANKNV